MIYIDRPDGSSEPFKAAQWRAHVNFGGKWQWIGNMAPPDETPDAAQGDAQPETTPPPERKNPPAIERVVITDRTNDLARKLIDSVFHEGETS